jgi:hypothetical protein
MKRNAIQAAALLPATASQSKGRKSSFHPPVRTSPFEVDLTDPAMGRYFEDPKVDLCVKLEERFPADLGQLSGIVLRIMFSGKNTVLNVESPAPQPLGSSLTHLFGYIQGAKLADASAANPGDPADSFLICLQERKNVFSGLSLTLLGGDIPELRVALGNHCLGILRDRPLSMFLQLLHRRCKAEAEA